jgi:hypothetical protein
MTFSFPLGYGRELSLAAAGFRYVVAEGVDEGGCVRLQQVSMGAGSQRETSVEETGAGKMSLHAYAV